MSGSGVRPLPERILARRRLIAQVGLVLVVLLGLEVLTIPFLSAGLVPLHVGLGLGAIPALLVKLAATGERAVRYYRGDAGERAEGAPDDLLRVTAVVLVIATCALFGSGFVLWLLGLGVGSEILAGPAWILVHELSFIAFGFAGLVHALTYAGRAVRWATEDWGGRALPGGSRRRFCALGLLGAGALAALLMVLLRLSAATSFG